VTLHGRLKVWASVSVWAAGALQTPLAITSMSKAELSVDDEYVMYE
jgi:hypothetical protein